MTAVIVTQPVMSVPELVMNCFAPLITHSPSSSRAVVRVLPASDPASGSVRPKAASRFPAVSSRKPVALLLVGAPEVDRHRAQRGVRGDRDAHRRVDPGQLLDRERVRERVAAATAVLLRERDAHQPELAQLGHDLVGEPLLAVELLGDRRDLLPREVPHGGLDQLLLGAEVEVHLSLSQRRCRAPARPAAARPSRSRPCRRSPGCPGPRRCRRCRGAPTACRPRTPPGTRPHRPRTPCAPRPRSPGRRPCRA